MSETNGNGISAGGESRWSKLQNAVLTQNHLRTPRSRPARDLAVYCALLVHADGQGRCLPCRAWIAEMSNMSLRCKVICAQSLKLVSCESVDQNGRRARSGK